MSVTKIPILVLLFAILSMAGCTAPAQDDVPHPDPELKGKVGETFRDAQAAVAETDQVATAETEGPFDKLMGHWIRTDGGYVIEIRSVGSDGQLDAGYFNPRPINVSVAKAAENAGSVEVFLELRDTNYPGSNYTLTYDPQRDVLVGSYFQAVEGQTFTIEFIRKR